MGGGEGGGGEGGGGGGRIRRKGTKTEREGVKMGRVVEVVEVGKGGQGEAMPCSP